MSAELSTSGNRSIAAVLELIRRHRVIPVVVLQDARRAAELAEALVVGGLYGAAHGALAMTTPGDTSMATAAGVFRLAGGGRCPGPVMTQQRPRRHHR